MQFIGGFYIPLSAERASDLPIFLLFGNKHKIVSTFDRLLAKKYMSF